MDEIISNTSQQTAKPTSAENNKFELDERTKKEISELAGSLNAIAQQVHDIYLPIVDDACRRKLPEDQVSGIMEYLLNYAAFPNILTLYKKMCRNYIYVYPECIAEYIEIYRELYDNDEEQEANENQEKNSERRKKRKIKKRRMKG